MVRAWVVSSKTYRQYFADDKHTVAVGRQTNMKNREILDYVGIGSEESDEEVVDENGRVLWAENAEETIFKVPPEEEDDDWLEAGEYTLVKAFMMHPQTRHLDQSVIEDMAATILYRFGE